MTTAVDKLVQGYCSYRDGSYENSRPLIQDLVERGQQLGRVLWSGNQCRVFIECDDRGR